MNPLEALNPSNQPVDESKLSLRERNKLRSRKMLEEAMAGTAVASGNATPAQQLTAQGISGGAPPLAPLSPLPGLNIGGAIGSPSSTNNINQELMRTVADRLPTNAQGAVASGEVPASQFQGNSSPVEVGENGRLPMTSIARVAYDNTGWRGEDLVKAVAVAMAESRGNPRGMGDVDLSTPGEKSVGLWQINYRPGRDEGYSVRDPNLNVDPSANARNAYQIFQDQGWGAWSVTHGTPQTNNNHFSNFVPEARRAVAQLGLG